MYARGYYGRPASPIEPNVLDRILQAGDTPIDPSVNFAEPYLERFRVEEGPFPTPEPRPPTAEAPKPAPATRRLVLIMLDPGHGGEDPGAVGQRGTREKNHLHAGAETRGLRGAGQRTHAWYTLRMVCARTGPPQIHTPHRASFGASPGKLCAGQL